MSTDLAAAASDSTSRPSAGNTAWIGEAKVALKDLFTPTPWIYWVDLTLTLIVAYGSAALFLDPHALLAVFGINASQLQGLGFIRTVAFIIAAFALFRAGSFAHEVVHLGGTRLRAFRVFWDLFYGIPTLFPSFAYLHHLDHHRRDHFGTVNDGEYIGLGSNSPMYILYYFLQSFVLPLWVLFRFIVITPISFLHPKLRQWTLERTSSFGIINLKYRREIPATAPRTFWALVDIACCIRATLMVGLVVVGVTDFSRLLCLYALAVSILILNFIRVIGLHEYKNEGEEMTYMEQLEDSITLPGHPLLTELFFPLGLRYHALHHLFPGIPYHTLGIAHRRLMAILPPDSVYAQTVYPSFWAIVKELWTNARAASRAKSRLDVTRSEAV